MILYLEKRRSAWPYRILCAFIAFSFMFSLILPPGYAQLLPASPAGGPQTILNLPAPGTMVTPTAAFTPTLIKGLTIHPENPLEFDFIVEKGQTPLQGEEFNKESMRLVKYFLASLTVPEEQMWVNLSPREEDRIISENLGATEMGKDMLAQDYILKQLTASLMYPEEELGKKFWNRIYKRAREQYGTAEIPLDTFNKVWIMPDRATVYEHKGSVFVIGSHLKVMLEEDYLAASGQRIADREEGLTANRSALSAEIIREIILPEIEKEVNAGETFASLRQIYNSMILATWYKKNLRESLLGQVYVDKSKIKGVDLKDPRVNQKIYEQYLEAFKKGVYNYIKEDVDPVTKEIIPRKYFSGGAVGLKESNLTTLYSLPQKQQAEIVKAFREIGNSPDSRFSSLKIRLYEIAQANRISEEVMTEIVQGIENTTADEAQELFVGQTSSSPLSVNEWIEKTLAGEENIEVPAALVAAEKQKREYVIGGNWKMAVESEDKAVELIRAIAQKLNDAVAARGLAPENLDIVIAVAPSFVHLPAVRRELKRMEDNGEIIKGLIALGAQDVSAYDPGARTSETSAKQLADLGIRYVIIGHSERRRGDVRETSRIVNTKVKKALEQGLIPIIAVGETLEEREAGRTYDVLMTQFLESTVDLTAGMTNIIIAYEPVWAIGTGKTATPQEADKAQRFLRAVALNRYGQAVAGALRIQYGGSMNAANVESLIQKYNIDGGLIGGAALKPDDFVRIVTASLDHFNASSPVVEKLLREYWEAGENQPLLLQDIVEKTGLDKRFVLSALETINNNPDMPFRVEPAGLHKKLGEETIRIRLVARRLLGELRPRSSQRGGARGSSPVERIEEINSLLERIDKEIERPGSGNLPQVAVISDVHGAAELFFKYAADAISQNIGRPVVLEDKKFPKVSIKEQLEAQGIDLNEITLKFNLLGDWEDRGPHGVKTYLAGIELDELGLVLDAGMVQGNHDEWMGNNLKGLHLPLRKGHNYRGHEETRRLVEEVHWNDPEIAKDRFGWWAARLKEYNVSQKDLQENGTLTIDGEQIKIPDIRKKIKDEIYPTLKERADVTAEQKKFVEELMGVYHNTDVFTGFNDIGMMPVEWWQERHARVKEYARAARETENGYGIDIGTELKRHAWEELEKYTQEAARIVRERFDQAGQEGKWWWQFFNDQNDGNYESPEWWAKDWLYHSNWGESVLKELNELEEGGIVWDETNYMNNPYLQKIASYKQTRYNLFQRDPYGFPSTHGWIPVDRKTAKMGFSYKGIKYEGDKVWEGLEVIERDRSNPDLSIEEVYEGIELVNGWYADNVTEIKPEHIAYNVNTLGLETIFKANGIGHVWFTGHNPQNKLVEKGLSGFKSQQGEYALITTDKGMSYQKYNDLGGYVLIDAKGIRMRGFSGTDFGEIVDNPETFKLNKDGKGGYVIGKKWENEAIEREDFLNIAKKQLKEELTKLQSISSPVVAKEHFSRIIKGLVKQEKSFGDFREFLQLIEKEAIEDYKDSLVDLLLESIVSLKPLLLLGRKDEYVEAIEAILGALKNIVKQHPGLAKWRLNAWLAKKEIQDNQSLVGAKKEIGALAKWVTKGWPASFNLELLADGARFFVYVESEGKRDGFEKQNNIYAIVRQYLDGSLDIEEASRRLASARGKKEPGRQEQFDLHAIWLTTRHAALWKGVYKDLRVNLEDIELRKSALNRFFDENDLEKLIIDATVLWREEAHAWEATQKEEKIEKYAAIFMENLKLTEEQKKKDALVIARSYLRGKAESYEAETALMEILPPGDLGRSLPPAQWLFDAIWLAAKYDLGEEGFRDLRQNLINIKLREGKLKNEGGLPVPPQRIKDISRDAAALHKRIRVRRDKSNAWQLVSSPVSQETINRVIKWVDEAYPLSTTGKNALKSAIQDKKEPGEISHRAFLKNSPKASREEVGVVFAAAIVAMMYDFPNKEAVIAVKKLLSNELLETAFIRDLNLSYEVLHPKDGAVKQVLTSEKIGGIMMRAYLLREMFLETEEDTAKGEGGTASSPVGASEDADDTIGSMVEHSQTPGSPAPVKVKTQELPDYAVEKGKAEDRDPYKEIISDSRVPGFSPMVIQGAKKEVGGIDLNPALLDLQIKRDGNGIPLPLPQQSIQDMHIEGFLPIIINITPVTNLPFLLGLTDTEQDADETIPAMKAREPEEVSYLN